MSKKIPFELKIVIIIAVLFGIVSVIVSRYYIINEDVLFDSVNEDIVFYFMIYIYAGLVVGIIQLIVAYGLYKGMSWAWYIAVIGCFGFLISNLIFAAFVIIDAFSIIINIVCLYLLFRPNVRKYFRPENKTTSEIKI